MDAKVKTVNLVKQKAETKKAVCGCIYEQDGNRWFLKTPCSQHTPNYSKKADKFYRKINKKTGRGYTKSPKRKPRRND